ncbi:GMC oxidoreductase [Confluentibacter flavum]|uniref:GMC family oxidoreductase n=1 Tax=Confluentibacter flavum TaxID=1909700 RepID=A0A2N3HHU4_9FLAO|nr:GMC family oxidoreductase [Confluentibacter flavum]PKQ44550.1 GMC family oxidoreductase [Confluentibacter flavum]
MKEKKYDAIVVGSGATGGFAAKELSEKGLKVLVLEAGPQHDEALFQKTSGAFSSIGSLSRIKAGVSGHHKQARASFYSEDKSFLFVNDWDHPYTSSADFFLFLRGKQVGGRFLSWGRVALRMSDYAFKTFSKAGSGVDWPIDYKDIEPYYEHVEDFLGLYGENDNIPFVPNGNYIGKAGLSTLEKEFKTTVETKWPERKVIPWRYVKKEATPVDKNNKRTTSPLAAGMATGNLELRSNAMVSKVNTDPTSGKATGVTYIDAETKVEHTVNADVVMLCASTVETIRLMLNSAGGKHPNGLGNSSGTLGKYFMDQVPSWIFGSVPGRFGGELVDADNPKDNHGGIYIPRSENLDKVTNPSFKGGFNIQGIIGRPMVPQGMESVFGLMGHGEMLPYKENYVSVHKNRKDKWGIPIPNINIKMYKNEINLLKAQVQTQKDLIAEAGYKVDFAISPLGIAKEYELLPKAPWYERLLFKLNYKKSVALGAAIHECGGARMGFDPKDSVLNANNQVWDAPNVFVTDSSCFPTNGSCGPTLTTMALTVRACDFIAKNLK